MDLSATRTAVLASASKRSASIIGVAADVLTALGRDDTELADGLLAKSVEALGHNLASPSKYHYLTVVYVAKKWPSAMLLTKTYMVRLL
jgi:hypothetical protein